MNLFFIIGSQKSGSTWLQRLLDSHPLMSCKGEGHFFDRAIAPMAKVVADYNSIIGIANRTVYEGKGYYQGIHAKAFQQFAEAWVKREMRTVAQGKDAIWFGDKTPAYSFHLGAIRQIFPEAKLLHIIRDGRDAAVSSYFHMQRVLKLNQEEHKLPEIHKICASLIDRWAEFTGPCLAERTGPHRHLYHEIRYEDLKKDPQSCLAETIGFLLGEDAHSDIDTIARCIEENDFTAQKARLQDPSGLPFLRKGIVGDFHNHFEPEYLLHCKPGTLKLLRLLGYADTPDRL